MAVVLRSSSDLVYVPDHGYDGVHGALTVLPQITPRIHRLHVAHNALGDDGVVTLARGLATLRASYSRPPAVWRMRELNLGSTACGDAGFEAVLGYARKDMGLEKVLVQANMIEMADNAEQTALAVNASRIIELSLNNNPLAAPALPAFFDALDAPALRSLHLSACGVPAEVAPAIAAYLCSPRARGLSTLELNGNQLGLAGVRAVVDAVERSYSLVRLGLLANDAALPAVDADDDASADGTQLARRAAEQRAIADDVGFRLPPLLERNARLTSRVRRAALRALAPARVLLAAQAPGDAEQAARVIRDVSAVDARGSGTAAAPPKTHFRFLDLPPEIQWLVARHTSGDAYALAGAQWARLRAHAGDRQALARAVRAAAERRNRADSVDEWRAAEREAREEWLRKGRWDKWEAEVQAQII